MKRVVLLMSAVVCVACGSREHMSASFGRQNRAFYAAQRVHPAAAEGTSSGLDSEEAAVVRHSYTKRLAPEDLRDDKADPGSRVLVIEEPKDGNTIKLK